MFISACRKPPTTNGGRRAWPRRLSPSSRRAPCASVQTRWSTAASMPVGVQILPDGHLKHLARHRISRFGPFLWRGSRGSSEELPDARVPSMPCFRPLRRCRACKAPVHGSSRQHRSAATPLSLPVDGLRLGRQPARKARSCFGRASGVTGATRARSSAAARHASPRCGPGTARAPHRWWQRSMHRACRLRRRGQAY